MIKKKFHSAWLLISLLALLPLACTNEGYDVGNGKYSLLHADFSMMKTDAYGNIISFLTDADKEYFLNPPKSFFKAKGDTVYRALVYYNETEKGNASIVGMQAVGVAHPFDVSKTSFRKQDPVDFISAWISENGTYLNFALGLKMGENDDNDTNNHVVGFGISNSESSDSEDNSSYTLTLYHDQNGVPEAYTITQYFSVPLKDKFRSGDVLKVIVQTYDGKVTKSFVVP
jgi:hypothetical protein